LIELQNIKANAIYFLSKLIAFFKGIVHPKMKILSSFTHPQVVTNLYEFHSLLNEDVFSLIYN